MDFIQEVRDLLDFINNYKRFGRIPQKALPELLRMLLKAISDIGLQKININSLGEALF